MTEQSMTVEERLFADIAGHVKSLADRYLPILRTANFARASSYSNQPYASHRPGDPVDPVTLIDPNGAEYTIRDPVELNDLVYGRGYRPKPAVEQAPEPPPLGGPGSSTEAWAGYAQAVGVTVDPDASREEVVTKVRKAGKLAE